HDHRDERGDKLEPAAVDAHDATPSTLASARYPRCSSRNFTQASTARVDGIGSPGRSPKIPPQRLVSLPRPAGYGLWVAARTRGSGLETRPWTRPSSCRRLGSAEPPVGHTPLNLGARVIAAVDLVQPCPRFVVLVSEAGDEPGRPSTAVVIRSEHREEKVTVRRLIQAIQQTPHSVE